MSQADIMVLGKQFFAALYGQPSSCSNLHSQEGNAMRIMEVPPTDLSIFLHVKHAQLHMLLWQAADQLGPPDVPSQNMAEISKRENVSRGQDYKRFSSMSRCSTHNLCSEMT